MNLGDILGERLTIVGGTGSGKSYTARGLVEKVLHPGGRVGIIDPTGVWHGLRVAADGKAAGFPVVIFGGDRSDVPLIETAGRVVAQAVASTHQSWIIDTSALKTKAAERRFMLDFLDALFETNREDIILVVDEADRFSPQRMNPESARLHERMEEIVRRGRVRGFTPWLITQRPASLNKDVLSQATAMICMRMTGAHDRAAMSAVIEGQADKATAKAIVDAMPRHKVGHGLVWAPQQDILAPVHFPRIVTLDTMRPAKPGERRADSTLPPIDIGALREKLATVEAEVKANDPKVLKAEIRRLTAELAKKPATGVTSDEQHAQAEAARTDGYAKGFADAKLQDSAMMRTLLTHLNAGLDFASEAEKAMTVAAPTIPSSGLARRPAPRPAPPTRSAAPRPPAQGDASLTGPQRHLLGALAWWAATGHDEPRRPQVAAIAGWTADGSNLRNRLSELHTNGLVIYPRDGFVRLTPEGAAAAPEPDLGTSMVDGVRKVLTGPQLVLFNKLLELGGGPIDRDTLAAHVNWEPGGSNLRNRLSELKTREVVAYPAKSTVQVSDWLQEG